MLEYSELTVVFSMLCDKDVLVSKLECKIPYINLLN